MLLNITHPFSSLHERSGDDDDFKLPDMASLVIIIVINLLLQLSFFIVVSSSNEYAEYLGGTATFSGVIIGIPAVFAGLALIPLARYDKGTYKIPLHVTCCFAILGHVTCALAYHADFLYLILIGRCLNGVAFSMLMYCKRFITDPRTVGIRRRTTLSSWLVACQGLGMSIGPFFGGLLYKIGFPNSFVNGYTSPGWVMAGLFTVFWVVMAIFFEDIPQPRTTLELESAIESTVTIAVVELTGPLSAPVISSPTPNNDLYRSRLSLITRSQWSLIVCMCWLSMICFFILGSWEANLPVFGAADVNFRWSPFAAGNFIALGGITCLPFLLANLLVVPHTQDRKLLAFGTALGLTGLVIFLSILRTGKVNYCSLFVCWWSVALGFNLATAVTFSILSKQLPPEWNGRISVVILCSNYVGRVTGAIWGGSGVSVGMLNFVGLEIAMVGIGAAMFVTLWRDLETKMG